MSPSQPSHPVPYQRPIIARASQSLALYLSASLARLEAFTGRVYPIWHSPAVQTCTQRAAMSDERRKRHSQRVSQSNPKEEETNEDIEGQVEEK